MIIFIKKIPPRWVVLNRRLQDVTTKKKVRTAHKKADGTIEGRSGFGLA